MCKARGAQHFCCDRCVTYDSASRARTCSIHGKRCHVIESGRLWHAASCDGLARCPLGCWIPENDTVTHVCPRAARGPIRIQTFPGAFASMQLAAAAVTASERTHNTFVVAPSGPFVKVITTGRNRLPTGVRVLLGSHVRADWICVEWRHANDNGLPTRQFAMITPHMDAGSHVDLVPSLHYNPMAAVVHPRIVSVTSAAHSAHTGPKLSDWSPLFGSTSWPKWSAITRSKCAQTRHPHIANGRHQVHAPPTPEGRAVKRLKTSAIGPYGAIPPAYIVDTPSQGCVQCARCGAAHADLMHFVAECGPDAILP